MNKRIQKLAEQAGIKVPTHIKTIATDKNDLEKFAELIISECQSALWTKECMQSDLALEEFKRNYTKIKEHFGVEE